MNNYLYVGKIINTFGIKGEVKIISDFEYKNRVFKNDFTLYIGDNYIEEKILTHKFHKNNDIILFYNYNNINDVLKYKNCDIYIKRSDLVLNKNEYLVDDIIGFLVYDEDKLLGKVISYEITKIYILLKVLGDKIFYIPKTDKFINKIDFDNKKIYTNGGSELVL